MEVTDSQKIMVNAMIVAMEEMLKEADRELPEMLAADSGLDENQKFKLMAITDAVREAIPALNEFLEDGDMSKMNKAMETMLSVQRMIGPDPFRMGP